MFITKRKMTAANRTTGMTLILASAFVAAAFPHPARSDQAADGSKSKDEARKVVVETLRMTDFQITTTQTANVHAFESVNLVPRISGYLKSLKVDIGDAVKRGQVLAEIDAPELAADQEKSQAMVEHAEARVLKAQAAVTVAAATLEAEKSRAETAAAVQQRAESMLRFRQKERKRFQDLAEKNAIPRPLVDEEEERAETARAALAEAKAQAATVRAGIEERKARLLAVKSGIVEAEASLRVARAEQRKTTIQQESTMLVAPFDGVVTRRGFFAGEFLRSGAEGSTAPVLTIVRTDKVRVVVSVPDHNVPLLDKGDRATVQIDAIDDRVYQGTIARTAYAEDPKTRTLRAEIDLDNVDGRLRPGQFGQVTIILDDFGKRLTIPGSALIGGRDAACYRLEGNRAVRTRLKIGRENGERVEVLDGLKEGDSVVVNPGAGITDGHVIDPERMERVKKD